MKGIRLFQRNKRFNKNYSKRRLFQNGTVSPFLLRNLPQSQYYPLSFLDNSAAIKSAVSEVLNAYGAF